jgi:hypothetical protein
MKAADGIRIAQLAAVVVGAWVIYRVVSSGAKTAGAAAAAVADVIKKDLNPASTENVIYKNIPIDMQTKIGDFVGPIFDKILGRSYKTAPAAASAPAPVDVKSDFSAQLREAKNAISLSTITSVDQIVYDQLGNPITSAASEFTGGATGSW